MILVNQGYIKLHRKLLDWEWYDDFPTFRLFTHLLLKVNFEDKKWRGLTIKRGSCVSSYEILHCETGLTVKQIRRALDNLIKTGEVAKVSTNENTVITVLNYDMYQDNGKLEDKQKEYQTSLNRTNDRQTEGNERATTKEVKKYKNVKKEKKNIYRETIKGFTDDEKLQNALFDFVDMRFKMGVFTIRALELALIKLGKLASDNDSKIKLVNLAIERGWKSFFMPKEKQQTEKKGYPKWWNQDNSEESNQTEKVDDEELCRIMESLNTEKEEDL